jgi:hypothetical protein
LAPISDYNYLDDVDFDQTTFTSFCKTILPLLVRQSLRIVCLNIGVRGSFPTSSEVNLMNALDFKGSNELFKHLTKLDIGISLDIHSSREQQLQEMMGQAKSIAQCITIATALVDLSLRWDQANQLPSEHILHLFPSQVLTGIGTNRIQQVYLRGFGRIRQGAALSLLRNSAELKFIEISTDTRKSGWIQCPDAIYATKSGESHDNGIKIIYFEIIRWTSIGFQKLHGSVADA